MCESERALVGVGIVWYAPKLYYRAAVVQIPISALQPHITQRGRCVECLTSHLISMEKSKHDAIPTMLSTMV